MTTSLTPEEEVIASEARGDVRNAIFVRLNIDEGFRNDTDRAVTWAERGLSVITLQELMAKPAPISLPDDIDVKTARFFRMAERAGVLSEMHDLWKTVGKPRFDGASTIWRELVGYFQRVCKRIQAERQQAEQQAIPRWSYSEPCRSLAFG